MSTKIPVVVAGFILLIIIALSGCNISLQKTLSGPESTESVSKDIPSEKILSGGPPKDGIPSIDNPKFESVSSAGTYLQENDLGISISFSGVARFYPNRILVWHEIVNDVVGGQPMLITYCPLCGTGIVFEPIVKRKRTEFGTSGKLYNSNLVMYDRQTDSLWSQILGEAIAGEMNGTKLKLLPYDNILWKDFKKAFPKGEVLSRDTGFPRNYNRSPYGDYDTTREIFFPVDNQSDRYHPKSPLFGLELNGKYRAYLIEELEKSTGSFTEDFAGTKIRVEFNKENKTGRFTDMKSVAPIIPFYGFWFSWYAVHPDTEIFAQKIDERGLGLRIEEKPEVGFLAPNFMLKDYNDNVVQLSDFRGKKAVMLNFWAGWCPFCLAEMPAMASVQEFYKDKLEVVAVNRGERKENAKRFTDSLNISEAFTILINPADDIFGQYGGFAMPSTFFIDKEGIIRDAHFGPLDSKQMKKIISEKIGI